MKACYTLLLLSILAIATVSAQSVRKSDHEAYFSDFYVMEAKPMQFEISYRYPKSDRVVVRIKDEAQNIIFAERTLVYKKYHKYFDLSTMRDGLYTFELTDGDEKFERSFVVATKTARVVRAL